MNEPWAIIVGGGIVLGAWLGPLGLVIALWLAVVMMVLRGSFSRWPLVVIALATLIGAGRMALSTDQVVPDRFAESSGASGTVISMAQPGGSHTLSFSFRVDELHADEGEAIPVDGFVVQVTTNQDVEVYRGDRLRLTWTPQTLDTKPPGYAGYLEAEGYDGTVWASRVAVVECGPAFFRVIQSARDRIDDGFFREMPQDVAALASGIVTGNDSGLPSALEDAFRNTGTSHVTAVSGSNIAMVLAIWNLFLPGRRGRRLLAIQVSVVASIWLYAFMTGLDPPATRAAAMGMIMLFGGRFGRRADPMSLLALSAGLMVLWNPRNVEMTSFWLSITASLGIISRTPVAPAENWLEIAKGTAFGTILAQIATLPIVLLVFGQWSLIGVVANLVLAPIMAVAFPLCFLTALLILVLPSLAPVVAWIPDLVLRVVVALVEGFAEVLPPVRLEGAGLAAALAVAVPCALGLLLLGRDGQRWLRSVEQAVRERRDLVALALWAPCSGIMIAMVIRAIVA